MTALQLIYHLLSAAFVLLLLFIGTFFLLFCERFVHARTQHRDGPGRSGRTDYYQVWTDFRKVRAKATGFQWASPVAGRFRFALLLWVFLPVVFLIILFSPLLPDHLANAELPLLLVLPLLASGIEALFMHATQDTNERYEWRKHLLLRIMGASLLYLAALAICLRVGQSSLASISEIQEYFPYHSILSSPGLFLCGIGAFSAIFLFSVESPLEGRNELSLHRSLQYLLFFVNKMWIFCLLCFWVFIFLGGSGNLLARLAFPFKAAFVIFLFTLLQASFPRTRSADAAEIATRWLLRLCLLGFLLEAVWVGVWG